MLILLILNDTCTSVLKYEYDDTATVRCIWFLLFRPIKLQIATVIPLVTQVHKTTGLVQLLGCLKNCLFDQGASRSLFLHHALRAALCALETYSARQLQCIPII